MPTGGTRFEISSRISGGTAEKVLTCFCLPSVRCMCMCTVSGAVSEEAVVCVYSEWCSE